MHRARLINACLDTTTQRDDRTSRLYSQPSRGSSGENLHNTRQILITDCAERYMLKLLYVNSPSAPVVSLRHYQAPQRSQSINVRAITRLRDKGHAGTGFGGPYRLNPNE